MCDVNNGNASLFLYPADQLDDLCLNRNIQCSRRLITDPKHPYTWGLLSAMPDLDTADERLYTIPGSPPNLLNEKPGDAFAPRNQFALEIDDKADPPMFQITDTHYAATWLLDPRAPKAEMPLELKERIARMKKEAKIDDGSLVEEKHYGNAQEVASQRFALPVGHYQILAATNLVAPFTISEQTRGVDNMNNLVIGVWT